MSSFKVVLGVLSCISGQSQIGTVSGGQFSSLKTRVQVPFDLALPFYTDDSPAHMRTEGCIRVFIPALLMTVKEDKKTKHSEKHWLKNFTVEFYML